MNIYFLKKYFWDGLNPYNAYYKEPAQCNGMTDPWARTGKARPGP